MYLKEIKISGFKSFADKINVTLDNNITCIVGPNGSGKSNIVDAVKWVLGEQSVKTLRGDGSMTDVIFSGSKSRNPLNLASVTLIFDNSDSYLKVPYTEISVTRKVYRSLENEYFINGEKCRLKDINDLFLDSGIGKYAFNIISQGEIANIINSSPYDRRVLFEEAAGVLKYKKRKEEALRKLDRTNENMIRIKDIIAELDTQIEPLRIQKDAAVKYLDYEDKLKNIEIALIASDLDSLNKTFHDTKEKIDKFKEQIAEEMSKFASSDVTLEKIKKDLNDVNIRISNYNDSYIEVSNELERVNGELNILKERSKYDSNDIKVHDNIIKLKEDKLILNNRLLSLKDEINIINDKIVNLDSTLKTKKNDFENKLSVQSNLEKEISVKEKNLNNFIYKIKSLTDYIEQGAGVNINVKRVLSNPKLSGIHNTIENLIDLDDSYSISLAAVLGGAKDYVVVEDTRSAKEAINYLKENNFGRVTFFPLDVIKERFIDDDTKYLLNNEKGFIGIFSNLVSYDDKYSKIIKNLLGNVILVDNIDNANLISKHINNRYRIVTLSGEVINIGGSITGGKIKTSSVVAERHELNNLVSSKKSLEEEIALLNNQLIDISDNVDKFKEEVFSLEKDKMLLEEEKVFKNKQYEDCKLEHDLKEKEINNLNSLENNAIKAAEDNLMNKYYEIMAKKDSLEKKSKVAIEEKEKLQALLEEQEANYKLSNANLRHLENDLKECEIINSKTSVRMDNLLNTLSENYQMTFEKARANYILDIDEDIARAQVSDYKNELRKIGSVNIGAIEEFDRVNTRYQFLRKQSSDLEEAEVTLLNIIDELDTVMKEEFYKAFKLIEVEFDKVFKELFNGGSAKIKLTDPDDLLGTGILINVSPPGKKLSSISLLSGGEKTLAAISLLFAILNIKKIPFCLFDEVEAALDEVNVDRVGAYFKKYSGRTQLIVITHKKKTMEYANTLYGITMQESGVSKLVSVKLDN